MTEEYRPLLAVYDGVVTDRVDQLRVRRVRVRVPGYIDAPGVWAWPIGKPPRVPAVGEDVAVFFKQGDPERPRYLPGVWGLPDDVPDTPEAVRDMSAEEVPDVSVFDFEHYEIVVDERAGNENFRIRDKRPQDGADDDQDIIEMDGVKRGVRIRGTVAVQIESAGSVDINALHVRINGRVVRDTSDPI